ncbi:MAG: prepilin-type N-terminal cleavage/methylation domain-containing protein [Phycisphaerales bacterium]|nr:prepilin-type N-terminal cleavage/methylation domain-containing protein [Phycisphaerales bacterium]
MVEARQRTKRAAFTLIELLVVISIIALLISILLPAMSGARRTAQRVACMATMREIGVGGTEYATDDSNGWMPGAPAGSYLLNEPSAFGPQVQVWDWMGQLASQWNMGLYQPSQGDIDGVARRFNELRSSKSFLCAANKFLSTHFGGPDAGAGRMVSYNMTRYQTFQGVEAGGIAGVTTVPAGHNEQIPLNWKPAVDRVGQPSRKIFCGDGSRFANTTTAPDYDLSVAASFGGAFTDAGAHSTLSRSWDRSWANGFTTGFDARFYAYRHATAEPPAGAAANVFKANFVFWDGHVETLGDLDSSNPFLWLPQGTVLNTSGTWPDTINTFGLGSEVVIGS